MQTLIYKTELIIESAPAWLSPGDPIELRPEAEEMVAAYARRPPRWAFLFGEGRLFRIGALSKQAALLLRPAFEAGSSLRVRVVEVLAAHLAMDGHARVCVSVWGDARVLVHRGYVARQIVDAGSTV